MSEKRQTKQEQQEAKKRRQNTFLAAFAEAGTISAAAKAARINRRLHFKWMESDPNYVERFCDAQEKANERLEGEARRRAVEGWKEPVFYEGVHVGDKPKYSDNLLMFLLKGGLPEKYKERYEQTGDSPTQRNINYNVDLTELSDEELKTLEEMADKLGGPNE